MAVVEGDQGLQEQEEKRCLINSAAASLTLVYSTDLAGRVLFSEFAGK